MIRHATADDLPDCLWMGERFQAHSPYGGVVPFDPTAMTVFLAGLIEAPTGCLLVTDDRKAMLGGAIGPVPFNPASLIAGELFLWGGGGRATHLIDAFETWARERGAAIVALSSLEGEGQSDPSALYAAKGYAPAERGFHKNI